MQEAGWLKGHPVFLPSCAQSRAAAASQGWQIVDNFVDTLGWRICAARHNAQAQVGIDETLLKKPLQNKQLRFVCRDFGLFLMRVKAKRSDVYKRALSA